MLMPSLDSASQSPASTVKQLCLWSALGICIGFSGCVTARDNIVSLPEKHSVRSTQLMVLSNIKLKKDHPYLLELQNVRSRVEEELDLKLNTKKEVHVYIFDKEETYNEYKNAKYPGLPPIRAYFVGTPDELMVYTYWGDRVLEDLRHEFTHGLLHSTLRNVPLWLDEGIAEYFEIGEENNTQESAQRLAEAMGNGWKPDMQRLEKLEQVGDMQLIDYQESWAWVDFMLHHSTESRSMLQNYLNDLSHVKNPGRLSRQMEAMIPNAKDLVVAHIVEKSPSHHVLIRGHRTARDIKK
jgi:hypothetical protein